MAQLFVGVWPSPKVVKVLADYPRPDDVGGWSTPAQWLANVRPLGHVADASTRSRPKEGHGYETVASIPLG